MQNGEGVRNMAVHFSLTFTLLVRSRAGRFCYLACSFPFSVIFDDTSAARGRCGALWSKEAQAPPETQDT